MTYQQYTKRYPIHQARNTGLYGFERVHDCLDLSKCVYSSRQLAGRVRRSAYEYAEANPAPTTVAEYLGRSS